MDGQTGDRSPATSRLSFASAAAAAKGQGIVAIPARLASTRLPNKLLLKETGRPLLAHVIDAVQQAVHQSAGLLRETIVAVDDPELATVARQCGVRAVMTGAEHRCGTTRIAEAIEKIGADQAVEFVVNVQGDEPEIHPEAILQVARELMGDPAADMSTLVIPMPAGTEELKQNPNAVKAILDGRGRAIYFSRAPVPYDRNPTETAPLWHHHLGIYAYRTSFLMEFARLPSSPLEERESLEQLRALDAGRVIKVGCIPREWAGKGIDTPEDYQHFVRRCRAAA